MLFFLLQRGFKQVAGVELFLPPGIATSCLPLSCLLVALRCLRTPAIRSYERELQPLAAAAAAAAADRETNLEQQISKETMAGVPCCRNIFVLMPLAARLMLLSRAATAAPALAAGDIPAAPLAARDAAAAAAAAARGIPLLWGPPGSHAAAAAAAAAAAEANGWRWEASEVYDITGDISYKLACCFMLLYGQPLLPRQPPPLDRLTIQTTKEKQKNTFIEVSLPTTMLGVYIHRSVQRCTGWSLHENVSLSLPTLQQQQQQQQQQQRQRQQQQQQQQSQTSAFVVVSLDLCFLIIQLGNSPSSSYTSRPGVGMVWSDDDFIIIL